jgi:hypothetical protein
MFIRWQCSFVLPSPHHVAFGSEVIPHVPNKGVLFNRIRQIYEPLVAQHFFHVVQVLNAIVSVPSQVVIIVLQMVTLKKHIQHRFWYMKVVLQVNLCYYILQLRLLEVMMPRSIFFQQFTEALQRRVSLVHTRERASE